MAEGEGRSESPLRSERGSTIIKDKVVARIAGMAAGEVEGVYMGGSASRAAGEVLDSVTRSQGQTRGVSVDVGQVEVAIDLTMGIEYGRDFLDIAERVRGKIIERVENMTGLRVTELNVTISDIISPDREEEEERRDEPESQPRHAGPLAEDETTELNLGDESRPLREGQG
jgi:uncharacterized alkaline shock family protein YloU